MGYFFACFGLMVFGYFIKYLNKYLEGMYVRCIFVLTKTVNNVKLLSVNKARRQHARNKKGNQRGGSI
jgi:hypothetical protein